MMDHRKLNYVPPAPITLEDDTQDNQEQVPCWAQGVRVGECTIVTGDQGKFACWSIVVNTSSSSTVTLRKRYSELDRLRQRLIRELPGIEVPKLPPKRMLNNLDSKFLAKRRSGIEWFLNCVLLDPKFAHTKSVRDFILTANVSN